MIIMIEKGILSLISRDNPNSHEFREHASRVA